MATSTCIVLILALTVSTVSSHLQSSVDWVNENMSPVDDQWSCGSCYGFATSALIEWKVSNVTGKLNKLSRQFIVDCMGYDGCAGGTSSDGFKYLMAYQYQPYDADYEYLGFYDASHCAEYGAEDKSLRNALADVWVLNYDRVQNDAWSSTEGALMQEGPVVVTGYISTDFMGYYSSSDGVEPFTDSTCTTDPNNHVMLMTGYSYNNGDPYITIRNSYSEYWGDAGYINYATNDANFDCRFANNAYTVHLAKRKELEYQIGSGRLNFYDAQAYCQGLDDTTERTGWDLAIVPTRMHNIEVFDMFTDKYGTDEKSNELFNYFWIGIDTAKTSLTWVDGSSVIFDNWDYGQSYNTKFAAMYKYNTDYEIEEARGKWTTLAKSKELRFMCSRYRYETCERISQTKIDNAFSFTMYNSSGSETLEIEEGTVGVFGCMDGYTLYGDSVTCTDGQWSTMPTCAIAA